MYLFDRFHCNWKSFNLYTNERFPFLLYEIGAWNTDGKSESIWDRLTHSRPEIIIDRSNGDIAADAYNKIDEDVRLLKEMKVDHYRFSIPWTRILPRGNFPYNKFPPYIVVFQVSRISSILLEWNIIENW